jgi:hypothetical protein
MMKRRIFLASLAIFLCAASALAQEPSDGVGRITVEELKALLASKTPPLLIDVRPGVTRIVKGSVNIPVDEIESRLSEIPRDREVVTYCS